MTDSFRIPAGRSALLIDGDNLGAALVPQILRHSGGAEVRRVYANLCQRKDWADQPDLRAIHSGTGKNATDMLIAIEAMELALSGAVASVVLASSDADFAHLAHRLRELPLRLLPSGARAAGIAARRIVNATASTRPITT